MSQSCCSCSTSPLADTLLVAERLNVARINIAVAQTARTPCIVASEEAKSEIAVKEVTPCGDG